MKHYQLLINGEWVGDSRDTIAVVNPASGEIIAEVSKASREMVQEAIDAAHRQFPEWSKFPARERAGLMQKASALMRSRAQELAETLTLEQGKPLSEALGEINISADYFEWNAEEAKRIYGETIPASTAQKRLLAIRQPVGVVASITPWNFPASMIARKIAPALAAGCTVVVKPATATPLSAVKMVQILVEAGIPAGVVNLVIGDSKMIGKEFTTNPKVRKISFTGSTEVGQWLMAESAGDVKRLSMELGGHAPFLVFQDANLDQAVEGVIASKFRNAGQTCICANRLYVERSIYEEFGKRLAKRVAALRVGPGTEAGVEVGPLINREALIKVERQVENALDMGGRLLVGGSRPQGLDRGNFYLPTVVADPGPSALVGHEETFGPLLGMWPFDDLDHALKLANDTPFGLASYIYAQNMSTIVRAYEGLEYGIVGVNDPVPTTVQAPFGGMKHSGFGREGGHQGLDDYLDWKFVSIGIS